MINENPNKKEILLLAPVMKECVWGGSRLVTEFGYPGNGDGIGECWAVSAHEYGDCVIRQGVWKGRTLSWLYAEHRELFGNLKSPVFPLLVKVLDARTDLSIQVHPGDEYARTHEGYVLGKSECWYILDCPKDARLVIGHHADTKEELQEMIAEGRYGELIRQVPVKKGDFIQMPPGTVHSITSGFLILEFQQNSDITYRVYDYDRLVDGKPRQLHVAKSIDVINVPDKVYETITYAGDTPVNKMTVLTDCPFYKVWRLPLNGAFTAKQKEPFLIICVMDGEGFIEDRAVKKGDHMLFLSGYGEIRLEGRMEVFLAAPGEDR